MIKMVGQIINNGVVYYKNVHEDDVLFDIWNDHFDSRVTMMDATNCRGGISLSALTNPN